MHHCVTRLTDGTEIRLSETELSPLSSSRGAGEDSPVSVG